jgi:3-oxoacyl-[acyl-carrier protein] reductase
MISLKDKVSVVTGGAQGIGRAIALRLAQAGSHVVVGDLNPDAMQSTVKELEALGVKAWGLKCDVADAVQAESFVAESLAKAGRIDVFVNNAGVTRDKLVIKMTPEDWDFVIKINLSGAFYCTRAVVPIMAKARAGRIVNIASVIGLIGNAGQANYSASKGGLISLTKTIAKEYASRGINCNAVAPGYIKTAMTDKLPDEVRQAMLAFIPKKDYGLPEDVADAVLFLASDMSRYITGQVLNVDGGMVTG